jgi:hypothetical protein
MFVKGFGESVERSDNRTFITDVCYQCGEGEGRLAGHNVGEQLLCYPLVPIAHREEEPKDSTLFVLIEGI